MSRLEFAQPAAEIKVDIESGTVEVAARAGKKIDLTRLKKAIEDAGYKVEEVEIIEPRTSP